MLPVELGDRAFPCEVRTRWILLIDDEPFVLNTVSQWLGDAGWQVVGVRSRIEALSVAGRRDFALAVVDYRLERGEDGIRLGLALKTQWKLPFVVISGYLSTSVVVDAMKAGAVDVIDKPLTKGRFISWFERAISCGFNQPVLQGAETGLTASADEETPQLLAPSIRWARFVLKGCDSLDDFRTVPIWGRIVGSSASTIEETCRLCNVKPHNSKDLSRVLRAVARNRAGAPLRSYFTVADERTLRRIFERAGLSWDVRTIPLPTLFLQQTLVDPSLPCLHELAHMAANSPLFF